MKSNVTTLTKSELLDKVEDLKFKIRCMEEDQRKLHQAVKVIYTYYDLKSKKFDTDDLLSDVMYRPSKVIEAANALTQILASERYGR